MTVLPAALTHSRIHLRLHKGRHKSSTATQSAAFGTVQVGIVQAAFSPSKAEVEAAMRLVTAFKEHQDKGHGAFVFKGEVWC